MWKKTGDAGPRSRRGGDGGGPPRIALIYRVVPHYRLELYRALHERLGLTVVTAQDPGGQGDMLLAGDEAWLARYAFKWRDPNSLYGMVKVPTRRILADLKPHLVVTEGSMSTSATFDLLIHRHLHGWPKVVFWGHGWQMSTGFASPREKLSQYSRLLPYSLADGHIVYSGEGATYLRQFFPRKPIFVAGNTQAFDVADEAVAKSIEESAAKRRPFTIIASGRFTPDKCFPRMVELFKGLLAVEPSSRLVLVGDGPDRGAIEAVAGDLLGDQVVIHGLVYDPDRLGEIFLQADLAAYAGAVGLAVNHAFAHGLPFVCFGRSFRGPPYHHPEIAYVVPGLTGEQVRPDDDEAFVRTLAGFAADRDRLSRFRRAARAFYKTDLVMEKYIDDFEVALRAMTKGITEG